MKKTLLTTTAISMFAGASFAATPTVTVGGYADFQYGHSDQESAYQTTNFTRDSHTQTDTEIYIDVNGKTDSGLMYGAHIELEADVNGDDDTNSNNNAERTYIYVESGFGRVELGTGTDAATALRVNAGSFARATGGINGDFYDYATLTGVGGSTPNFFILPGLPTETGLPLETVGGTTVKKTDRATANKVTYYTPRVGGLQAGLSYTPDQSERGTSNGFSGNNTAGAGQFENVFNVGANYEVQVEDININASITADLGDSENTTNDDLKAYAFGATANFAGFSVGGSYGIIDEFGQTSSQNQEGDYYTLGAAYEFGPVAASVGYFSSTIENGGGASNNADAEFQNLSVGADYQLAPGLVPYVEVSFFETDDNLASTSDNEGSVFIVGTELSF